MLQRIVALMPLGAAVVDAHRDVVYLNDRAKELGLVRDRQLDDQAWEAAQQALTGVDVEFDLQPAKRAGGRSGLSVHGQARLLSEEDRRFAVVFAHDQSDYARMEATRRDFVANVSHELKTRWVRWRCSPRPCWPRRTSPKPCGGSPRRHSHSKSYKSS